MERAGREEEKGEREEGSHAPSLTYHDLLVNDFGTTSTNSLVLGFAIFWGSVGHYLSTRLRFCSTFLGSWVGQSARPDSASLLGTFVCLFESVGRLLTARLVFVVPMEWDRSVGFG